MADTDRAAALDAYEATVRAICADPRMPDRQRLVAVALATCRYETGQTQPEVRQVARALGWTTRRVRAVIAADRPRTEPVAVHLGPPTAAEHPTGGTLAEHFPDLDWDAIYAAAGPPLPAPRSPHLTVITGGAA